MTDTTQQGTRRPPLFAVRVIDLTRLAPGPYCTMLLSDLGAEVIVVGGGRAGLPVPALARGKRFMALDLKRSAGRLALHELARTADVVVEGFRPGVAARIGAGYGELSALNPRLIYCSLTGYGQDGPRAQQAGHDINYLAISGVLGAVGPVNGPPVAPLNLLADFGAGGLLAAFGILAALFERERSGLGQCVDAAMIDGCLSMMAMHFPDWGTRVLPGRGEGLLSGAAPFYRCYACADGKFVSIGALERAFFEALWRTLGLGEPPDHMDVGQWPQIEHRLEAAFRQKPRDAWEEVFAGHDACIAPVLAPDEVWQDPQIRWRHAGSGKASVPPIPRFSQSPARAGEIDLSDRSQTVLTELGVAPTEAAEAVPTATDTVAGLSWPPNLSTADRGQQRRTRP